MAYERARVLGHAQDPARQCHQAGLGEYDLGISFEFARRDGRYHLIGVTTIDVGSAPEDLYQQYEAELASPDGC